MNLTKIFAITALSAGAILSTASAQNGDSESTTIQGCLSQSRGNYIVVEDKTGLVYALKGVGNKLNGQLGHEVSVVGRLQPGTLKTGVRSAKDGSNPADTIHGVSGTPFEVKDAEHDIQTISKHCHAADAK